MTLDATASPLTSFFEVELQLGLKGRLAGFLENSPLLVQARDAAGYAPFRDAVGFSGTLRALDAKEWHDRLAAAARAAAAAKPIAAAKPR